MNRNNDIFVKNGIIQDVPPFDSVRLVLFAAYSAGFPALFLQIRSFAHLGGKIRLKGNETMLAHDIWAPRLAWSHVLIPDWCQRATTILIQVSATLENFCNVKNYVAFEKYDSSSLLVITTNVITHIADRLTCNWLGKRSFHRLRRWLKEWTHIELGVHQRNPSYTDRRRGWPYPWPPRWTLHRQHQRRARVPRRVAPCQYPSLVNTNPSSKWEWGVL